MNFRTTVILIALLAVGAAILLFTRDKGATPNSVTEASEGAKLIDVPSATVNNVSIVQSGEKPIVLQRDGVNWRLTEPVQAPAEANVATQLVDDVVNLRSKVELSKDQAS